jgi:CTP synthase (UTP-ammonia lyase)
MVRSDDFSRSNQATKVATTNRAATKVATTNQAIFRGNGKSTMHQSLSIGIIGDYNPNNRTHTATNEALSHAAAALAVSVEAVWLSTPSLDNESSRTTLQQFDALWCAPASPYESMDGALRAIQFAREAGWPFIGT